MGNVSEYVLAGGNTGGAVRVGETVRRSVGPWTKSVHALLHHLERVGFVGAPRVMGLDDLGREVLSFLPGNTVGDRRPWPAWVHSDNALIQVARWLRGAWVIPDWALVAGEWDAIHLPVSAYLESAGRAIEVAKETASVIAGWDPDTSIWLAGARPASAGAPQSRQRHDDDGWLLTP